MRRKARVLQHLVAQLPEELDLKKESIVIVTGDAEDGWYRGELPDGTKSGIFPRGFVSIIETEDVIEPQSHQSLLVQLSPERPIASTKQNDDDNNRPYGTALYDFNGQHDDELTFCSGQMVELIRHVNDEWMEGRVLGRSGIFPTAFVNIVVDVPLRSDPVDNLLMDFDPFGDSAVVYPSNETTVPIDLESVITRNINQLGSSTTKSACSKVRPNSWTQTLAQIQLEYSVNTPVVPPRRHESQSHVSAAPEPVLTPPVPVTRSIRPPPLPPPPILNNKPCTVTAAPVETIKMPESASHSASTGDEPVVEDDSAASSRKSYTRPAPPPPPKFVPATISHRSNQVAGARQLTRSLSLQPAPPIPVLLDSSGKWCLIVL